MTRVVETLARMAAESRVMTREQAEALVGRVVKMSKADEIQVNVGGGYSANIRFADNRISVRFEYESHDPEGQWWRSHGNEHWEFDEHGYMRRRDASINDYRIEESERRIHPRGD